MDKIFLEQQQQLIYQLGELEYKKVLIDNDIKNIKNQIIELNKTIETYINNKNNS